MESRYKATVIISIYNNIKVLKLVLDSLKMQSEQSFEIIISEDAEHSEVAEFCDNYDFIHDYQHLSQPDNGWAKNKALNRAIQMAKSDYLIFVDGDCILHPRFIEQHLKLSGDKNIIAGKRVKLNSDLSKILMESVANYHLIEQKLKKMLFSKNKEGNGFIEEGIFINPSSLMGLITNSIRSMRNLKGCNMSFPKSAIVAINGFDEDYTLPAVGEDIDLVWRFKAAGYKICSARNQAVQYHIYHKENWSDQSENRAKMEANMSENRYICKNGIKKL